MRTMIYCEVTEKGIHSFYLMTEQKKYFLFCQNYRKGVHQYFSKGVSVNESINYSRSHNDNALQRTMTKIPKYIKYIEQEHDLMVMNQTKKREASRNYKIRKCA